MPSELNVDCLKVAIKTCKHSCRYSFLYRLRLILVNDTQYAALPKNYATIC